MGTWAKEFLLKSYEVLEHKISNWLISNVLDFTGNTNQSAHSLGCYDGKAHPACVEYLYSIIGSGIKYFCLKLNIM